MMMMMISKIQEAVVGSLYPLLPGFSFGVFGS